MSYSNFTTKNFELPGAYGNGDEILAVDLNNDGWQDLLVAGDYVPNKNVPVPVVGFLNQHGTGFKLAPSTTFGTHGAAPTFARDLVVGDFNHDGHKDVFIADTGFDADPFPGQVNTLLLGKSGGGFSNASSRLPTTPDFSHSAGAADIDGDGDLDIFVNNLSHVGSSFLINDGTAHFTQSDTGLPEEAFDYGHTSTLFFDADHDGDQDLFLGGFNDHSVVLLNDGHGTFTAASGAVPNGLFGSKGSETVDAKAFDFNGDGNPDILADQTSVTPFYVGGKLQVLVSDGAGGVTDETSTYLKSQPHLPKGSWLHYVTFVDLNNDGKLDIMGEPSNQNDMPVSYINDGTNHFYQAPASLFANPYGAIEGFDFNKDGWTDFVQVHTYNGHWELTMTIRTPPPAHMTGTGSADTMLGGPTANTMAGEAGKDLLSGAGGSDRLDGGDGNDTLLGGAGNDTLIGGAGKDVLDGAQGHDVFRFSTATASSIDTVTDFTGGVDHIQLAKAGFAHIGATLDAGEFVAAAGAVALDGNDHILYDTATGRLSYDPDGSGSAAAVAFAVLAGHPALAFSDFSLI